RAPVCVRATLSSSCVCACLSRVCAQLSLSLCLCVCGSISLCLCVCAALSLSLPVCVCGSISAACVCVCSSLSLPVCVRVCVAHSRSLLLAAQEETEHVQTEREPGLFVYRVCGREPRQKFGELFGRKPICTCTETFVNRGSTVVILHQQGLSQTKISKQTGVSRCAVQALLKKHKKTGKVEDRRRSGRPRKLSAADERHITLITLRNRKISSSAISSELAEASGTQVHPSTVRRNLARTGLYGRVAAKNPYLRRGNKAKRLKYARKHRNWGAEKWQQVLWTDESKFEIFGCSRRQFVRRRAGEQYNNECLQATVKHGGASLNV
uniref:Transposase Tc1-like domain-containing protein n=1 Tax=Erpetoichthys calabaricus TaxID=27687 RepID=A0A8C4S2L1_ERPCA